MTTFRNTTKGSRGILLTSGKYVTIAPGQTETVRGDKIKSIAEGLQIINPAEVEPRVAEGGAEAELPAPPSSISAIDGRMAEARVEAYLDATDNRKKLQQLDHDGDGAPGGSLPADPPSLSGMSKAKLIEQAEAEGILIEQIKGTGANGNVIADDIKAAIEAKRAAAKS